MKHVLHLTVEPGDFVVGYAQQRLREIAGHGDNLSFAGAPLLAQRGKLLLRALAHENVNRVAALQKIGDEMIRVLNPATLEEARKSGALVIAERGQASVPELVVENRGKTSAENLKVK